MPACLLDTNVWIAATFSAHPFHALCRSILTNATVAEPAVFCRATEQSFLRLASTPALLQIYGVENWTNRHALQTLEAFLSRPNMAFRDEAPGLREKWHQLARRETASPKLWMDAYLAAFAISSGLRFVTLDADFDQIAPGHLDLRRINS